MVGLFTEVTLPKPRLWSDFLDAERAVNHHYWQKCFTETRTRKCAGELLFAATERTKAKEQPDQPKPHPIAVLPLGLPIAEVITKLSELQNKHPDAIVKRGRANKWEIWPGRRLTSLAPYGGCRPTAFHGSTTVPGLSVRLVFERSHSVATGGRRKSCISW